MKVSIYLIIIIAAYLVSSNMDFEDMQRDSAHYERMVDVGHWPDYKGNRHD